MTKPGLSELVDKLLEGDAEFDDLHLEQLPQEDLLALLQALRGHAVQLTTLVTDLSTQAQLVEAFARPKIRRYVYAIRAERIIQ